MKKNVLIDLIFSGDQSYLKKYRDQYISPEIYDDLLRLEENISKKNYQLKLLSVYRSFQTQKKIWNLKINGTRDVLDSNSKKIDITKLTDEQLFFAILNWSAFPGLSRHHFGTDMDIADNIFLKKNPTYIVKLVGEEYLNGVFNQFYSLVKSILSENNFYFPYQADLGGIKPEPWHISHQNSRQIIQAYDYDIFLEILNCDELKDFQLLDMAKKHSHLLYQKYFLPLVNK